MGETLLLKRVSPNGKGCNTAPHFDLKFVETLLANFVL